MQPLVTDFEKSLFNSEILDIGLDMVEIGIDSILDEGLVQEIPIVRTVIGFGKTAQNIHDRNLLKQTVAFIQEFNNQNVSAERVANYRQSIRNNPKKREEELGRVLILLNKNIDVKKSLCEGRFFAAFIEQEISWLQFCELCDITDRLFIQDIGLLREAYKNHGVTVTMNLSYQYDRLIAVGLLTNEAKLAGGVFAIDLDSLEPQKIMEFTNIGKLFCDIIFKDTFELSGNASE